MTDDERKAHGSGIHEALADVYKANGGDIGLRSASVTTRAAELQVRLVRYQTAEAVNGARTLAAAIDRHAVATTKGSTAMVWLTGGLVFFALVQAAATAAVAITEWPQIKALLGW